MVGTSEEENPIHRFYGEGVPANIPGSQKSLWLCG